MLQDPAHLSTFERYLDRYGWPTFILLMVILGALAIVRALWPIFSKYINALQETSTKSFDLLAEKLRDAEDRIRESRDQFLLNLEKQRSSHEHSMELLADRTGQALERQSQITAAAITEQTAKTNLAIAEHTGVIRELKTGIEVQTRAINELADKIRRDK
jgi:hypothetical protein